MNDITTSLDLNDSFTFSCNKDVPCFNECCQDLNQFITPYDVLRLKNHFGMTSEEFHQKYTEFHIGPESGLPVVTLRSSSAEDYCCPYVTPEGCAVYTDRPSSCRAYPIARAIQRSRETGETNEYFMLMKEPHCKGHGCGKTQTVKEFITEQGLTEYNQMNDRLMDIISLKNRIMPGPLDQKSSELFYLALYNLDTFRAEIFERNLLGSINVDDKVMEDMRKSDESLLLFGHGFIRHKLFGIGISE